MSVAIVTDSAAALPDELVSSCGIDVVAMGLTPGVGTAAPSPGEFAAAAARGLEVANEVVVLTVAGTMSATYEAARLGCASFGAAVRVVDTRSAAGGEGLVVLAAARAAAAGTDAASIVAQVTDVASRVRLIATLPDLDHIARSGRVPGVAAWAGKRLRINPLFEFRDGVVRARRPALSRAAALDRIVAQVHRSTAPGERLHAAVLHAGVAPVADAVADRIRVECAPRDVFVGEFGPVMVLHTGLGVLGVAWWWEPPDREPADR